jgi:D-amino peptidase
MVRTRSSACLPLALALLAGSSLPASAQSGLKVYISADMEGVAGVVTGDQLGPSGFEYGAFREYMTREVLAAIDAAREMGATEIVVSDSHGNGENLLLDLLPEDVLLVRSWPRPLMMMEGIDESFDAALLVGYHASTGNPSGVRAHTMSSANLAGLKVNGVETAEAGVSALIAGHFGVPVVMISGDDAIAAEATGLLGDIETAVVKWSYGFHSARTLMPGPAREEIAARTRAALGRLGDFRPYDVDGPLTLDLTFKNYMPAELLAYLPNVDRVDAHTVRFVARDAVELSKFIEFAMSYGAGITP